MFPHDIAFFVSLVCFLFRFSAVSYRTGAAAVVAGNIDCAYNCRKSFFICCVISWRFLLSLRFGKYFVLGSIRRYLYCCRNVIKNTTTINTTHAIFNGVPRRFPLLFLHVRLPAIFVSVYSSTGSTPPRHVSNNSLRRLLYMLCSCAGPATPKQDQRPRKRCGTQATQHNTILKYAPSLTMFTLKQATTRLGMEQGPLFSSCFSSSRFDMRS